MRIEVSDRHAKFQVGAPVRALSSSFLRFYLEGALQGEKNFGAKIFRGSFRRCPYSYFLMTFWSGLSSPQHHVLPNLFEHPVVLIKNASSSNMNFKVQNHVMKKVEWRKRNFFFLQRLKYLRKAIGTHQSWMISLLLDG